MSPGIQDAFAQAAALRHAREARTLLAGNPAPGILRAVIRRAEELCWIDPRAAVTVAEVALACLARVEPRPRRPTLAVLAWSVYGSTCRATARFDEAEVALALAARLCEHSQPGRRVDVMRRFAYLRADQRRGGEARRLIACVVEDARKTGGRELGRALAGASAVSLLLKDPASAARDAEAALRLLPANGDRHHLSSVFNLAVCRLELSASAPEMVAAWRLIEEAARLVEPDSVPELKLQWLAGTLLCRLGYLTESLAALSRAHAGLRRRGDAFERALLTLDLAELHFQRGAPQSAYDLAFSSLGILSALRDEPDACRALEVLYSSALAMRLDLPTVRSVRTQLRATRP